MRTVVTSAQARARLAELLELAAGGDTVVVTRRGRPDVHIVAAQGEAAPNLARTRALTEAPAELDLPARPLLPPDRRPLAQRLDQRQIDRILNAAFPQRARRG